MLHILKRHPIPIAARFEKAIALTYAVSPEILTPMLVPGLELDSYRNFGFLAVTTVHTVDLRPAFLPRTFGRNYLLTSYRLFTRFTLPDGRKVRGLQTLRSDTNSNWLVTWGNRMTRYEYRKADLEFNREDDRLQVLSADLELTADLSRAPILGPEAPRDFIAPLLMTFDYEPETHSVIVVEARRTHWQPQPCAVEVQRNSFIQQAAVLAGAFFMENVSYRWSRGRRITLSRRERST